MIVDCDLVQIYGELVRLLPESVAGNSDSIVFSEINLPEPALLMHTNSLCVTWAYHFYNDFPIEQVSFEATQETYRLLGLLLLACIFHKPEKVLLELKHLRSTIQQIVIRPQQLFESKPGLISRPLRFNYYPELPVKHPWIQTKLTPYDLPVLTLTNQNEMLRGSDELPFRNTVIGFGSDEATCLFAELLLNTGLQDNTQLEFCLEGECGFRGVGPGSTEIMLWLPGELGHLDSEPIVKPEN